MFTRFLFLFLGFTSLHKTPSKAQTPETRWVDDILFDHQTDSKDFALCRSDAEVFQYFNDGKGLNYEGDKPAIVAEFQSKYKADMGIEEEGLLRIRFIVNCKGESGRFRAIGMDREYREKKFHPEITRQLLEITKGLRGWKTKTLKGETVDYYQYLIFVLEKGNITQILP